MSHMVIFQTPDGNPGYNQFESLDEAVRFVETLRNEQGVETARMFALEEVKFDFRPYFRVEIDPPMISASSAPAGSPPPGIPTSTFAPEPTFSSAPSRFQDAPPAPSFDPAYDVPAMADIPSPMGTEQHVSSVPPPTFMAPAAPTTEESNGTSRRGLFGR